jgi:hypothetical protein
MPIELSRGRESVEAVLSVSRLLMLDDLWTAYLDHADKEDVARDISNLESLVGDMREGLGVVRKHAKSAAERLQAVSDEEVNRTLDDMIREHSNAWPDLRDSFTQDLAELGVRRSLAAACIYVDQVADEEMSYLDEKLVKLQGGSFERGDFRFPTRCTLELAGIALCVLGCIPPSPLCIVGIILTAIALIEGWKNGGCRREVENLIAYLRQRGLEPV